MASCENVKRSWVNYGQTRDWSSMEQGQVGYSRDSIRLFGAPDMLGTEISGVVMYTNKVFTMHVYYTCPYLPFLSLCLCVKCPVYMFYCVHVCALTCACYQFTLSPLSSSPRASQGEEFLYHATEVKNIWLPMGEIFAN